MASGVGTRGQVARTMAGAEGVETKATVPQNQIEAALQIYGLSREENERYVYFFDTPDLELFGMRVIVRARRFVGFEHDNAIKFRPVDPDAVPALWRKYSGFEIEADSSEMDVGKSASPRMPVAKELIKRVVVGKEPIASPFTEEQPPFLRSLANRKID
jgi:hypothetical protein